MNRRNFLRVATVSPLAAATLTPSTALSKTVPPVTAPSPLRSTAIDLLKLLDCIAEVETGRAPFKPVKNARERSKYQITEAVWNEHMSPKPFSDCHGGRADLCALRHINKLNAALGDDVYWLAFAWNGGLSFAKRVQRGSFVGKLEVHHYAERVMNLYNARSK